MAIKPDYITALQEAIWNMHGCRAAYLRTEHVHETFKGKTVWDGDVEVFAIGGHAKAQRAYAWAHLEGENNTNMRFYAVLELPPVKDAKTAVQASILANSKTPQS